MPGLAELLREAAGPGAAPLTVEKLRARVAELFDLDEFRRYLGRLPRRRMPGCDQLRFELLRALAGAGYAGAVRDFTLGYALGDVPDEERPYAYGGRLVAPTKPGGDGHRPLGAGGAFRRAAAGFLAVQHARAFGATLGPVQLGVGLSRGPQIFALAVRLALESSPGSVVCKLDFNHR